MKTGVIAGLVFLASVQQASAQNATRDVAAELAKKVREVAGGLKPAQSAVRIGLFAPSGYALDIGAGGGAFQAELALELAGFLNPAAPLEVKGEVYYVEDPEKPGNKVIKVMAKLVDRNGTEAADFKTFVGFVRKVTDIGRITGATVSFKSDDDYKKESSGPPSDGRNKDLQKSLPPAPGKPPEVKAHIAGALVRARKDSPYAVEIRKKPLNAPGEAKPKDAELKDGLAFVKIEKGELYEVRVLNHSPHEIAVSLAIDGIDQFTFSDDRKADGSPRFGYWIVGPCEGTEPGDVLIRGWHKTAAKGKGEVLSFLVTDYGKGAASKFPTKAQGAVGTITVGIAASHLKGSKEGEKGGTETGFGPPVKVEQEVVERKIEAPHEFITVRYNR